MEFSIWRNEVILHGTSKRRSILIGVLLSLIGLPAYGTGPLTKPQKIGQKIIWRNKIYTAIKRGKVLVWDSGKSIQLIENQNSATPQLPKVNSTSPTAPLVPTNSNLNIVGKSSDLSLGETKLFSENDPYGRGARYLITRTNNGLIGFDNKCTHEGCGIEDILPNNRVKCSCHGAEFEVIEGRPIRGPANAPLKLITVKEIGGNLVVTLN